ncbi:MAG: hypothetical protein AAF804_11990 [Bacteroidota bacterium]
MRIIIFSLFISAVCCPTFAQELDLAVDFAAVAQWENGSWVVSEPSEELLAWSSQRAAGMMKPQQGQEPRLQGHSLKVLPQGGWAWDSRWQLGTQRLVLRQTLVTKDDYLLLLAVGQWEACLGQAGTEPSFSDDGKGCDQGQLMLQAKLH